MIIAFSLFRKPPAPLPALTANKYIAGMLANIEAISSLYPTAEVWIYHDDSLDDEWLQLLKMAQKHSGLKVQLKLFDYPKYREEGKRGHIAMFGTLIRYLSLADFAEAMAEEKHSEDSVLLIRDADMIINQKDLECIEQFKQQPEKLLHRYIDSHHYRWPIIGGSFAVKPEFLNQAGYTPASWRKRILEHANGEMLKPRELSFKYFVDQEFLREIYNELKQAKKLELISTTEIHIPIAGQHNVKVSKKGHYKLWWFHIADEVPETDFTQCKDLKKWLAEHSDAVKNWIRLSQPLTFFAEKPNRKRKHSEIVPSLSIS